MHSTVLHLPTVKSSRQSWRQTLATSAERSLGLDTCQVAILSGYLYFEVYTIVKDNQSPLLQWPWPWNSSHSWCQVSTTHPLSRVSGGYILRTQICKRTKVLLGQGEWEVSESVHHCCCECHRLCPGQLDLPVPSPVSHGQDHRRHGHHRPVPGQHPRLPGRHRHHDRNCVMLFEFWWENTKS